MLPLRKVDWYGQLILAFLSVLSMLILFGGGLFIGLFLLGCWQLISAIFNTKTFIQAGFQKRISHYWIFCIADLLLLSLSYSSINLLPEIPAELLSGITWMGAVAIAVYYWKIYFKLIEFISLRNELDGLTKSKH